MDAVELDRFFQKVIKGPDPAHCWIWVGAIADDGYGRFAIRRNGREKMTRPQRLRFEHVTGVTLRPEVTLLHDCDIPICVHATAGADSHLFEGDLGMNMRDREQKHRTGRGRVGMRGISRVQLAERSRALRAVILEHGWDRDAIAAVVAGVRPETERLF